ncbi:dihydrofolate reductase [Peribacillus sp. TH16]|uniref:dihydrofolate reductase family protein n=1 Tax=Peribacillus sp. TH16 TaxID=2798482 RepID=UPI0019131456|nr:dihydrofolate reductase family protein [Peribacillus sp. TH16]MBK5484233.1 dihydrofolate reductase [Peribacillus sp. TH16]
MVSQKHIVMYIATSMDGHIARENGSIDWLEETEGAGDNGYGDFFKNIDTVIMGNKTYQQIHTLAEEFPYQDKTCYVFSRSAKGKDEHVEFVNEDVGDFIGNLKGDSRIWLVGGAELVSEFMRKQLVDEMILSIIPTVLGKGISLFQAGNPEVKLKLTNIQQYGQIAQLHDQREK